MMILPSFFASLPDQRLYDSPAGLISDDGMRIETAGTRVTIDISWLIRAEVSHFDRA